MNLRIKVLRCVLLLAAILAAIPLHPSGAQLAPGPIVKEIAIEYVGKPSLSEERVRANLATKVGEPYSERTVEADIRALYATNVVSNVRIFGEPLGDGVKVTVLLQGRPVVAEVIIEGAEQIKLNRVRREISTVPGDALSEEKLDDDRRKALKLYQDRNYSDVDVQYKVVDLGDNKMRVTFLITEGRKVVVRAITFAGNYSIKNSDIRKVLKTKTANILSIFTKDGRLLPDQLEEDKAAIRRLYQNRGFADAQVTGADVQPLENGIEIVFTIVEGIQYHVRAVTLEGVQIAPPDQVKAKLKMIEGSLFTPNGLTADLKALRDFYGSQGYIDLSAVPEVIPAGKGAVDLVYQIEEGVQSYVNLINIQGNTRTKDYVIRRELAIKPGEVFDLTKVDVSRERLVNLNYFEPQTLQLSPQETLVPGRKDLNVIVQEKRTGSFNFGAGFSTIDNLIGFAEIQQTNFDLFNWPRFVGGGQRFRIRAQYGIQRRDFVVSFTEPWLLGYKLSFGVEAYYRDATFLSTVYNQANYGMAFQFRKAITNFIAATAEYRIERIHIFDVDTDETGPEIQEAAGYYTKSAVSGALTYDTRDSLFLTRKGEYLELGGFIAGGGLGGTVDDYGVNFDFQKYFPLPFDTILSFRGQIALVDGFNGDDVPIFDRLYLGGANTLRGFDFRDVGPKDDHGNPIGGNSSAYATVEFSFPIVSRLRGYVFSDWGFVNRDSFDYSFTNINGDVGVGLRIELPIGPIRVDYGYPIKHDADNGSSGKFNFNVGYQF